MKSTVPAARPLRVLLAGSALEFDSALTSWLDEQESIHVTGSGRTTAETLALASVVRPDVVLLDFHGRASSTDYTVALFKELSPAPAVFLLTHGGSCSALRRFCLRSQVDAVFETTAEFGALGSALEHLCHEKAAREATTTDATTASLV